MNNDTKSPSSVKSSSGPDHESTNEKLDVREQLYNDRLIGQIQEIQLPIVMITRLSGIMLDIDPILFREDAVPAGTLDDPNLFFEKVVGPWMKRHSVLQDAEVRMTGQGLHLILWFAEAVEFTNDGDRQRWAGVVKAVQAVLPTDPDAPGITATTRALESVNSKNDAIVKQLCKGKPIPSTAVLELFDQMRSSPFRTIMGILFGSEKTSPCPVCRQEGSSLSAQDRVGHCYGGCGNVKLHTLYDIFLKPRPASKKKK